MTVALFVVVVSTGIAFLITLILGLVALLGRSTAAVENGSVFSERPRVATRILLPISLIITLLLGGVLTWMLLPDAGSQAVAARDEVEQSESATATPEDTFTPAGEDEILVIIAVYEDRSDGAYRGDDIAEAMVRRINNSLPGDEGEVRVELYPEVISSAEAAFEALADTGSLLVIYGWHDAVGVESYQVYNTAMFEELMDLPEGAWATEDQFDLEYTIHIALHTDFLANYILGVIHSLGENYRSALVFFSLAGDVDEIINDHDVAKFVYLWLGYVHGSLKEFEQAVSDTTTALDFDPAFSWAYTNRGIFYLDLWEYQLALDDLNIALELLPGDVISHAYRGMAYQGLGETDLALEDFAAAIELDPNYGLTYGLRGFTHDALGAYEQAISDYNTAIKLDPETAFYWAYRGNTYYDLGDFDQAIEDYTAAIALDEEYDWAYACRGLVYYYQGDYRLAISDFDRTIEITPDYVWAYGTRALTYHDLGDYEKALDDYTRAIELDPENAWAYASRGWTYYTIGQVDNAIADLNTAIDLDPEYAWAYFARGFIYENADEHEKTIRDYEMAIKLDPENFCYLSDSFPELECP